MLFARRKKTLTELAAPWARLTGTLLIIAGIALYSQRLILIADLATTTAAVTGTELYVARSADDPDEPYTLYQPVLHFSANGLEFNLSGPRLDAHKRYPEGTQVPIYYERDDPDRVTMETFAERWAESMLMVAAGIALLVAGEKMPSYPWPKPPESPIRRRLRERLQLES